MSTVLAHFQDSFARAVARPGESVETGMASLAAQPGFAIYRNTVLKGCVDALQANYPCVTRLVGEEWFRAAAALFVRAHPPREPMLFAYGDGFDAFLSQFKPAADLPYLPGVARLDRCWTEAHAAADAAPYAAADTAGLSPEALADSVLRPHPAARWHWFESTPVYTIWRCNREEVEIPELDWCGEGALLTRPADTVNWQPLDAAGCAFMDACALGLTLAESASAALAVQGNADLARLMATLLEAGAFAAPPVEGHLQELQ